MNQCSFLNTREDHLHRCTLPLGPKSRFVIGLENEDASRADRVSAENAFILLACDSAGLTTFSIHKTNDRAARPCWPCWARRSCRTRWSRLPLLASFAFCGQLTLPASGQHQCQGNNEPTKLHDHLKYCLQFLISWFANRHKCLAPGQG